jgi:hypothetical protein
MLIRSLPPDIAPQEGRYAMCEFVSRRARSGTAVIALSAVVLASVTLPAPAQDARTNRIQIEYVPPKSPEYQSLVDSLKANHGLEKMQEIFSPFACRGI